MKIVVNIEGSNHTYSDETPIKEITGLFDYFTKEVSGGDIDLLSLAKAILLHKDMSFEDLENIFSYLYTREPDEYLSEIIPELVVIGEACFLRIKDTLLEDELVLIADNDGIGNLLKTAQKDALAILLNKGVNNLNIENPLFLYPNISIGVVLGHIQAKQLEEYTFSRDAISKLYHLCISYAKKSEEVANKLFEVLKNTTGFKAQTKGYGDFKLVQKEKCSHKQFGFPEFEPAIMGYNAPDGIPREFTAY